MQVHGASLLLNPKVKFSCSLKQIAPDVTNHPVPCIQLKNY